MSSKPNKIIHRTKYILERFKKELKVSYAIIIPCCLILGLIGYPFFNLSFVVSLFSFPLICILISLPTVWLLELKDKQEPQTVPTKQNKWEFINNRFNKID